MPATSSYDTFGNLTSATTSPAMTEFQAACIAAVQELLLRNSTACNPIRIPGIHESYYRIEIASPGEVIDLHIYEDEAGYFVGRQWYIRESQDYEQPEELIGCLVEDLERRFDAEQARGS